MMFRKLAYILTAALWVAACAVSAAESPADIVDAAARQNTTAVRALVKAGANVNAAHEDGATALLWASHWDDLITVDLLLQAGAKVNVANDYGVTPLAVAVVNVSVNMVERLLRAGADPNLSQTGGRTPLMTAALTGNVPIVEALLARRANVNAVTTETKSTALMWAASAGFRPVINLLIGAGANPHASTLNGMTPLLYAAQNGDIEIAKALITAGVDVNETGSDGTHPLPFAIIRNQGMFALFLLDQGADPNGRLAGVRALHLAATGVTLWATEWSMMHPGGRSVADPANRAQIPPGARTRGRLTPAVRLELVKTLLARGGDPNVRAESSGLFASALIRPRLGAFETFATGTGDLRGATPLWMAANAASGGNQVQVMANWQRANADGFPDIMRALLVAGADPHLTTADGTTPLMVAAGLGGSPYFTPGALRGYPEPNAEEAVRILVEAGADVNAVNEADFTALHGASFRGLHEVIEYLVKHGANVNARDFRGRTPYRIAEGAKQSFQFQAFPETAEFLKRLGADPRLGIPGTVMERAEFYAD